MRFYLLLFVICLLNVKLIRTDDDDDDDPDEEVMIEETTKSSSSTPPVEKGYVPTIRSSSSSNIYFEEQFQDKTKWSRWIKSQARKDGVDETLAKYDGEWGHEIPHTSVYHDDYALILKVSHFTLSRIVLPSI